MSLTLREIKLLKQRRKNRDRHAVLTSSVLTYRGFHCTKPTPGHIVFILSVGHGCLFFLHIFYVSFFLLIVQKHYV